MTPKKRTILGTDHALSLPAGEGTSLDISYWDLWLSIAALLMDDGELDRAAQRINYVAKAEKLLQTGKAPEAHALLVTVWAAACPRDDQIA